MSITFHLPCFRFAHTSKIPVWGIAPAFLSSIQPLWMSASTNGSASHKVFAGLAGRGKTSTGWFFGFKLHLVINDRGELLNVRLTPGNVDDRKPVPELVASCLVRSLATKAIFPSRSTNYSAKPLASSLMTKLKSNSKNRLPMSLMDRILLRKRAIIETVIDQLKNISQIEHSRHRSVTNFLVNLVVWADCLCSSAQETILR